MFEAGKCVLVDLDCKWANDLASDALTYLESNKTRVEIDIALHVACAQLNELSKYVKRQSSVVQILAAARGIILIVFHHSESINV